MKYDFLVWRAFLRNASPVVVAELSMGWVDPWVGLVWVGSDWVEIFQFLVGWVGSTTG